MLKKKVKPEDFRPAGEAPAVRKAAAVVQRAEAKVAEAGAAVAEAEAALDAVRDVMIDAVIAGEQLEAHEFKAAKAVLDEAIEYRTTASAALERARAKHAEIVAQARADLVEALTAAVKASAASLNKILTKTMRAANEIGAFYARAGELGIAAETPDMRFTGRLVDDHVALWRAFVSSYDPKPPRRSGLVTVRFVEQATPVAFPALKSVYGVGEEAGFPVAVAATLVSVGVCEYADGAAAPEQAPPEPQPAPRKIEGPTATVRFRRKWLDPFGRLNFMTGDVTTLPAAFSTQLVADGVAELIGGQQPIDPDDGAAGSVPSSVTPVEGTTDVTTPLTSRESDNENN